MKILSDNKVMARKDHICDWCGLTIQKGTEYRKSGCTNDGEMYTWKNHTHCTDLFHKLNMEEMNYGDGVTGEDFREHIREHFHDIEIRQGNMTFEQMMNVVIQTYL